MNKKTYYMLASVIFAVIAVAHALRAYYGWEAQIGDYVVPVSYSWVAVVLAGYLSIRGWQFATAKKRR